MVAERLLVDVFFETVTLMLDAPVPEVRDKAHQEALEEAVQESLPDTSMLFWPPAEA